MIQCTYFHSIHHIQQPGDRKPLEKPAVSRLNELNRYSSPRDMWYPSWAFFTISLALCWQSGNFQSQFRTASARSHMLRTVAIENPSKNQRLVTPLVRIQSVFPCSERVKFAIFNQKCRKWWLSPSFLGYLSVVQLFLSSVGKPSEKAGVSHLDEFGRPNGSRDMPGQNRAFFSSHPKNSNFWKPLSLLVCTSTGSTYAALQSLCKKQKPATWTVVPGKVEWLARFSINRCQNPLQQIVGCVIICRIIRHRHPWVSFASSRTSSTLLPIHIEHQARWGSNSGAKTLLFKNLNLRQLMDW